MKKWNKFQPCPVKNDSGVARMLKMHNRFGMDEVELFVEQVSLKPQLQTVVLQFSLKPQLVTVVLQLFLIHTYFNGVILILFLKYFFIKIIIKPQLVIVVLQLFSIF